MDWLKELLKKKKPSERYGIADSIAYIESLGSKEQEKSFIFSAYVNKMQRAIREKKYAVQINEDIDKITDFFIPLKLT